MFEKMQEKVRDELKKQIDIKEQERLAQIDKITELEKDINDMEKDIEQQK